MFFLCLSRLARSLDAAKAQIVVEEIRKAGGSAIAVSGDVGADDFPEKIVQATVKEYGKINHIINNGQIFACLIRSLYIINLITQLDLPTTE